MSIANAIAVSGLSVASLRLQVSASNIANASSDGPLPGTPNPENFPPAYSALRVNQVDNLGGGTSATVANVLPPTVATYDPTAPYADGRGMVTPERRPRQRVGAGTGRPVQLRRQRAGHPRRRADEYRAVQHHCLIKILRGY